MYSSLQEGFGKGGSKFEAMSLAALINASGVATAGLNVLGRPEERCLRQRWPPPCEVLETRATPLTCNVPCDARYY